MADEYSFKLKTCYCGLDLADKKAEVSGYFEGLSPMGKCPECGRSLLLDAPALEISIYQTASEPAPEPVKKKGRTKPEPVPEPEPEPEPES